MRRAVCVGCGCAVTRMSASACCSKRRHSTAHSSLRDTAKVVFLADKMDPHKAHRFSQMPKVRELAMESLDEAIVEFLSGEMTSLIAGGGLVHPASVDARNALLMRLQEKAVD